MKRAPYSRKTWTAIAILLMGGLIGISTAGALDKDIADHPSCPYCGMDRQKFAHTRVYIQYADMTDNGTCSLHCAVIEMAQNIDKEMSAVMVGDFYTKSLIDAETAFWVIGGDKMGVMTTRAKWAFGSKDAADRFTRSHGGRPATFDGAIKASFEDMYDDIKMIRNKRKMMRMKRQQKN